MANFPGADTGGSVVVVPVRWFNWRNTTSYQTVGLVNNTWIQITYTSELAEAGDGAQGIFYGSGSMGNDSGRTITGHVVMDAICTTDLAAQTYYFGIGVYNGTSWTVSQSQARSILSSAGAVATTAGRVRVEFSNITLEQGHRYIFYVNRYGAARNLRVYSLTSRFLENTP